MTLVPDFLRRNLSLKLLSLTIAIVVYYALRERDDATPAPITLPTGVRSELPTHIVVVPEDPGGATTVRKGRLVRATEEDGTTVFKWLDEAAPTSKPAREKTVKGISHAVLPIR